jgi:hypothetical protein
MKERKMTGRERQKERWMGGSTSRGPMWMREDAIGDARIQGTSRARVVDKVMARLQERRRRGRREREGEMGEGERERRDREVQSCIV